MHVSGPFRSKDLTADEARLLAVTIKSASIVGELITARRSRWPKEHVPNVLLDLVCEHHGCTAKVLLFHGLVKPSGRKNQTHTTIRQSVVGHAATTLQHKRASKPIARDSLRSLVQMWMEGKDADELHAFIQAGFKDPNLDPTPVIAAAPYRRKPQHPPSLGAVHDQLRYIGGWKRDSSLFPYRKKRHLQPAQND